MAAGILGQWSELGTYSIAKRPERCQVIQLSDQQGVSWRGFS